MSVFGRVVAESLALALAVLLVGILLVLTAIVVFIWAKVGEVFMSVLFVLLPLAIIAGAVLVPILAITVNSVRNVRRTGGLPQGAVLVPSGGAPRLRRIVVELAAEMNAPRPTHLWLTPHANASVHESRRLFRRPRRIRHLCVGVPLLAGLTAEQLRAVLCHELCHCLRRHGPFSTTVYRGSAVLRHVLTNFRQATLPTSDVRIVDRLLRAMASVQVVVFRGFAGGYDLITVAVRRYHEYQADRVAAGIVGPVATAEALRQAHIVNASWTGFRTMFVAARREAQRRERVLAQSGSPLGQQRLRIQRPGKFHQNSANKYADRLFHTFAAMLNDPNSRLTPPDSRPDQSTRSPHPPLEKRLAALGRVETVATPHRDHSSALNLLADDIELLMRLECLVDPDIASKATVGLDTKARKTGISARRSAHFATALFTIWFFVLVGERVFQMFGAASALAVTRIIFAVLTYMAIITALIPPPTQHALVWQRKRQLRRWINPATGLVITYGALVHLMAAGMNGALTSAVIWSLGVPFFNPSKRVSATWAVLAFSLALTAIQTAPLYRQ